jgi:hypothetical protein
MSEDTKSIRKKGAFSQGVQDKLVDTFGEKPAKFVVPVNPKLIKFYGGWEEAAFVQQLGYWQERATKTEGWVFKTYEEWAKELSIDKQKVQRMVQKLTKLFVEKGDKVKRFAGKTKTRLRINAEKHEKLLNDYLASMKLAYQNDI